MKKYRVRKWITDEWFQIVEAKSEEEAIEIAQDNEEKFESYWDSTDYEPNYSAEEVE